MLVGGGQGASAFLFVQLQRLPPRGHKPSLSKRQRPPFCEARLVLVGGGQGASAFLFNAAEKQVGKRIELQRYKPMDELVLLSLLQSLEVGRK